MTQSHKTWHLTINNYTQKDIEWLNHISPEVTQITASAEKGETGTPHIQARITFKQTKRLAALKKLHPTGHWTTEIVNDSALYCLKADSNIILNIHNSRQGQRSDLQQAVASIQGGASIRDMFLQHPETMVRYSKGIRELHSVINSRSTTIRYTLSDYSWTPITDWSTSHIIVGPPGIGKTEFAKAHFQKPLFVTHLDDLLGFADGDYDGIIFDDMSFLHLNRNTQIHLTDVDEPRSIHCRYRTAEIPANTKKIFTTNIRDIFDLEDRAIARRVTVTEVSER